MIHPRWYKVFNDLSGNKTRTMLIILSIAVGLFAVGTIISTQSTLSTEMAKSYQLINPSNGIVRTLELFEEDFVQTVRAMPNVKEVDARRIIPGRVLIGPEKWLDITLFVVEDYEDIRVNKIFPISGAWPPPKNEILIERSAMQVIHAEEGKSILIDLPGDRQKTMRVAGVVHDMAQVPAQFDYSPYGYITFETAEWLGEPHGLNELDFVTKNNTDPDFVQQVINEVKDKTERNGMTIPVSMSAEAGMLPLDDILQAILAVMGVLGALSLFLSIFLIINTVSAILAQQRRQIGVMKAIGGDSRQLIGMYLVMVLIYGVLALLLSIPLSVAGANGLSKYMANMFNFDLTEMKIPVQAIGIQIVIGLTTPVLASLFPFLANLRITAADAMRPVGGDGKRRKIGVIDRILSGENLWFTRNILRRPTLLSARNTFRSKWRLALTLITLALAGSIFISVFSVRDSIYETIYGYMELWSFDTLITFDDSYRFERIQEQARLVKNVDDVDIWLQLPTRRVRPDGSESKLIYMFAPRAGSKLVGAPEILEGRFLLPEDENALVIDAPTVKEEPDLKVGDMMILKINGQEHKFRIVGIAVGMMVPVTYANYPYIAKITGQTGRGNATLIRLKDKDEQSVLNTNVRLEDQFENSKLDVKTMQSMYAELKEGFNTFNIIVNLLLIMAFLLALVGGLGLMGTMSINVLERTREIGILRTVGASTGGVAKVFILEGITIGLISWFLGSLLAFPLGKSLSDTLGEIVLGAPLGFTFSISGMWLWLILASVLSALASFLPARNASRMTVREVLAYE